MYPIIYADVRKSGDVIAHSSGMYVHAADPFYMRGINKDGMGYVETNWNLPLWEQINLARQNIYDGTWTKIPSQGWMFVPIDEYHGGWPECCIEPAGFLGGQWEWYLQMYFGTGVSPNYRGAFKPVETLVPKNARFPTYPSGTTPPSINSLVSFRFVSFRFAPLRLERALARVLSLPRPVILTRVVLAVQ